MSKIQVGQHYSHKGAEGDYEIQEVFKLEGEGAVLLKQHSGRELFIKDSNGFIPIGEEVVLRDFNIID